MQESGNSKSMLRVGIILRGVYRIDGYLSSGGFGNTYIATNTEFEETVAIKEFFMKGVTERDETTSVVSVSNADNVQKFEEQREKFKKEARRLRKLSNEHIVKVYDLFDENGTSYYVMDFIDGENLAERLKRTGKPMPEKKLREILPQILDALKTVHQNGFCHLDLKPSNIMLEKSGLIKLIDFGASKQLGASGTLTTNDPTALAQTPGFAPREQMEQNFAKIGPWTDIYALGATLYNLLTKQLPPLPTNIDDDETEDKHNVLPFPSTTSDGMKHIVLRMMNTNRTLRPQNIDVIIDEVRTKSRNTKLKHVQETGTEPQPLSTYDDETTFISQPLSKEGKKDDNPKKVVSKEVDIEASDSYINDINVESRVGKNFLIICFVCLVGSLILYFVLNSGADQTKDSNSTQIEEVASQTVIRMHYSTAIGNCQYAGPVDEQGVPNGYGEAFFDDGRYYKGFFDHGVLNGKDSYFKYSNGDEFKGEFSNNSFYYGMYVIAEDGSYFVGSYKNGQPDDGTWYDKNSNVIE